MMPCTYYCKPTATHAKEPFNNEDAFVDRLVTIIWTLDKKMRKGQMYVYGVSTDKLTTM